MGGRRFGALPQTPPKGLSPLGIPPTVPFHGTEDMTFIGRLGFM